MKRGIVMDIEKEFFALAKKMNEQFSIIPLLIGSVGLNMLVDDDVWMGDLDIVIPHYMRPDRKWICPNYVKFMENEGYEFVDVWEGEFHKGEIMIHTSGDNLFEGYADIDIRSCPIVQTDGAIYKMLTLEQHLILYTATAEYKFRDREENNLDYEITEYEKIEFTRKALARNKY
jgi:hypothetical protein